MALDYIKLKNHQKYNNPGNWLQGCHHCKKGFAEDEKFIRIDVKVSVFRGDDEVYCFHNACFGEGVQQLEKHYGN